MALDLLTKKTVQVQDGNDLDWQTAIKTAAQPLVDNGTVGDDYVQAMIDVVEKQGPYINIGPEIALAHSRPRASVKRVGLSLLKTNSEVNLVTKDHPVKLWLVLAATDSNSHLGVIQQLSQVLMDSDRTKKLLAATSTDEILDVLKG